MQTFRKLPTIAPNRPAATSGAQAVTAAAPFAAALGEADATAMRRSTSTRPSGSISNGTPAGSSGIAAEHARRGRASASRAAARRPSAYSARRSAAAGRCHRARRAAPARAPRRCADIQRSRTARSTATSGATTGGLPPSASVIAASDRSHHGAPGASAALANHVPAAW